MSCHKVQFYDESIGSAQDLEHDVKHSSAKVACCSNQLSPEKWSQNWAWTCKFKLITQQKDIDQKEQNVLVTTSNKFFSYLGSSLDRTSSSMEITCARGK